VKTYSGIQFADKQFIKQKKYRELDGLSMHEKDCCNLQSKGFL